MNFGRRPRAFIEDGPAEQAAKAAVGRSTARTWHLVDEGRRLELVERALFPANDFFDGFPLAL